MRRGYGGESTTGRCALCEFGDEKTPSETAGTKSIDDLPSHALSQQLIGLLLCAIPTAYHRCLVVLFAYAL